MTERKGTGAILLAGGRATRLGGIDKPLLEIDGRSLLQRALDAVAGCDPVVVAGPARSDVAGDGRHRHVGRCRARRCAPPARPNRASHPHEGDAMSDRTLPPEALDAWAAALRERFGLADDDLPIALILDLARDVANGVARPAAPFSAFAAGLVAGRAGGSPDDVRAAVAAVTELAAGWDDRP
ncbi:MAG: DUF6457 domain-containing protein [Microbacterium hominis]|jgi:hypothetical protein|uniref:DUF6457 domain-containing protein n=2 Tax=Microbacteriaceae TaxID=85023 RepID=UPI00248F28F2|nr:DUF6457 domain-containing protein [Microbacterium aurum]MBZ6372429.1 DUF6457 domain-containing protein [Microbacterium hominis]